MDFIKKLTAFLNPTRIDTITNTVGTILGAIAALLAAIAAIQ
jgi:hypothetical protein